MSTFDVKSNKAICVLPWVHEFTGNDGRKAPCCSADNFHDGETMIDVRAMMLEGKQPNICGSCYKNENHSKWSKRLSETTDWIAKFGEPNLDDPELQFIDLRFDATCNLKCKTCGPYNSTLWQKEKGIKIQNQVDIKEKFSNIDKQKLKKVYMAGGEPTYIFAYKNFLEQLYSVNPNCEVIINTNLKSLPDAWKEIIKKFTNLTVICSCDAIDTLGEYVRYPLDWKKFEDNVKFASENANFFQFNLVASNLTAHRLYDTCNWMKKYSNNIFLSVLDRPEIFSEKAIPPEVRQKYIESVQNTRKIKVSSDCVVQFRSAINLMVKNLNSNEYSQKLQEKLKAEITEQDSHRKTKLEDVDNFLQGWIFS